MSTVYLIDHPSLLVWMYLPVDLGLVASGCCDEKKVDIKTEHDEEQQVTERSDRLVTDIWGFRNKSS